MATEVSAPWYQGGDITIQLSTSRKGDIFFFTFPVGLEGLGIEYGTRAAVTQALDAVWLDSLGSAIVNMTISGHTGYKDHNTGYIGDGREQFQRMVRIHKEHQRRLKEAPNKFDSLLLFSDPSSGFIFWCFATNLKITRDKSSPILFHFEWDLTVVKDSSKFINPPSNKTSVGSKLSPAQLTRISGGSR